MIFAVFLLMALVVYCIASLVGKRRNEERRRKAAAFYDAHDRYYKAVSTNSPDKLRDAILGMDLEWNAQSSESSVMFENEHRAYRKEMTERLQELEYGKWLQKAEPHLVKFEDAWNELMRDVENPFRDADYLMAQARKCVSEWQSYYAIDLEQFSLALHPKRYFREFMGDDYDPCMEDSEALRKKLDERVNWLRPEAARKRKLYRLMVDFVENRGTVRRSELLKTPFDGYIPEEVRACYRDLIAKNRIVAVQIGKPYFVSLSDKEIEKRHAGKNKYASRI